MLIAALLQTKTTYIFIINRIQKSFWLFYGIRMIFQHHDPLAAASRHKLQCHQDPAVLCYHLRRLKSGLRIQVFLQLFPPHSVCRFSVRTYQITAFLFYHQKSFLLRYGHNTLIADAEICSNNLSRLQILHADLLSLRVLIYLRVQDPILRQKSCLTLPG